MRSFLSFRTGLGTCPTLNVGDKLLGGCNTPFGVYYTPRGYEKPDVAAYLVCDVAFDATTRYIKLQYANQPCLNLWVSPLDAPPGRAGRGTV